MMNELKVKVKSIEKLLKCSLSIPSYQRSYRWTKLSVLQLLEDINTAYKTKKCEYRVGSVIIYNDEKNKTLEIVDGQQRITTILLLLKSQKNSVANHLLNLLEYNHIDSKSNIITNYDFINEGYHTAGQALHPPNHLQVVRLSAASRGV